MTTPALPPVTDAHRQAAFAAMGWAGWTFDAAMANDTRRRVIEARAASMRTAQFKAAHARAAQLVRRFNPAAPAATAWAAQRVAGPFTDSQLLA